MIALPNEPSAENYSAQKISRESLARGRKTPDLANFPDRNFLGAATTGEDAQRTESNHAKAGGLRNKRGKHRRERQAGD